MPSSCMKEIVTTKFIVHSMVIISQQEIIRNINANIIKETAEYSNNNTN